MATTFALKNPNPGVWFRFNEDDPDSGEICIRAVTPGQLKEMTRKTTKKRPEYKGGQRFVVEEHDEEKFARLLWDYVIVEWKDLQDEDGNEIPCTVDSKYHLMMDNIGFARFVAQCRERVEEDIKKHEEAVEKN